MSDVPAASPQPGLPARYDAFISYSHAKDKPVAAALQSVMQKLGKPWHQRRALRIFRDDTSLAATPELWPTIEQALAQSRYLIVLASPQFAASKWCGMEVAYWLEHKSLDTLLVALTEGELAWDDAVRDFRRSAATPLPSALGGKFRAEPKWIDLRAHHAGPNAGDAKLIDAAADLAAAVHGMPKEDLLSQEVRQQKRALALAWSAAAVLLALVGAAGWQWAEAESAKRAAITSEQRAVAERDRAERNLALARKAAEDLVFRIAAGLREAQGMRLETIRQILRTAEEMMDELIRSAPDDVQLQRSRAAMLVTVSTTYLAAGDIVRASAAAEQSLALMRKLVAADPGHTGWQHDLSVSLLAIGDVRLAAGDRSGASAAYEESLALMRKLTAADARNARWQHNLSMSLERVGNMRLEARDVAGALAAQEESLAIMRGLAAANAGHAGLQRLVSVSLNRIAAVRLAASDRAGALAAYEESLAIVRKLAAADEGNAGPQRDEGYILGSIGDVRLAAGDRTGATAAYEESLVILRKLAAADPGNAQAQNAVSSGLVRIGDARLASEDRAGALAAYEESLAIVRKLTAVDAGNANWWYGVIASLTRIGEMRLAAGDRAGAFAAYEERVAIVRRLAPIDPGNNTGWQLNLMRDLHRLSTAADPPRARAALREALAIVETLEREGKLTAVQRGWLGLLREALAALPPEAAAQ